MIVTRIEPADTVRIISDKSDLRASDCDAVKERTTPQANGKIEKKGRGKATEKGYEREIRRACDNF